jgi:hypothetical protein
MEAAYVDYLENSAKSFFLTFVWTLTRLSWKAEHRLVHQRALHPAEWKPGMWSLLVQAAEWVKLGRGLCFCNPHFLLSIAHATHTVAVRDWVSLFCKKNTGVVSILIFCVPFLQKYPWYLFNSRFKVQRPYKVLQNFVYKSDVVNTKFCLFYDFLVANEKFFDLYQKEPYIHT